METYVFGAGASAPYGAPIMGTFLGRAFSGWTLAPPDCTHIEQDLTIVAQAIDAHYGTNLLAAQQGGDHFAAATEMALAKINLEELLALAGEDKDNAARKALERVIFNTIERNIQDGGNHNYYDQLMSQLAKSGKEACLISFNYDLLLDRALTDATRHATSTWSYAMPFDAGIEQYPSYRRESSGQTVSLLKLHGSLNWGQCPRCKCLRLWPHKTFDNILRQTWPSCEKCSGISTGFEPVLVAPTPAKLIPRALECAWNTSAECLRATKKLTVIGYSFPAFDRQSRVLFLKNFIIPNLSVSSRPRLAIVDRDVCTRKSIRSWFLPAVENNVEEYSSFEDYCNLLQ